MFSLRTLVILAALAFLLAALLAVVSRAPAEVRNETLAPGATDPEHGDSFTDEQVARHGAYRGPAYLFLGLTNLLSIAALIALARGPLARFVERVDGWPGGWITTIVAAAAFITVVVTIVTLPLGFVRGYAIEQAWGLSTQDVGGWISDQVRGLGIGIVMAGIAAVAFFGLVRWQPNTWWLWGWGLFSLLFALLVFLFPIVIAPIFNKFTPLQESSLRREALSLAQSAGVRVDDVLVADASRRTSTENAYVAGLGATKRLVLYDTLVQNSDEDEAAFVIAHELGHEVGGHVVKNVLIGSAGLLISFLILRWLATTNVWSWSGATGIGDIRALPVLLLIVTVLGIVSLPVQNAISRRFEREADATAISLTRDPAAAVRSFRRLAFANLADLRPPAIAVTALYSHPPIPDRIREALSRS